MNLRWPAAIAAVLAARYASESLRHRREGGRGYTLEDSPEVGSEGFLRAAEALTQAPISRGNRAELLINGDRIFPAMLEAIGGARRTVNLLTYIYWSGEIGSRVADAVCERATAGVSCRVLLDAMGSVKMDRDLLERMTDCGVSVCRFRPPKPYAIRRGNNRTHRKLLVVDGKVGFTGGVGIADEWTGDAQDPDHWRDTHVRVEGPVVRGLQGSFAENWLEATGEVLAGDDDLPELDPIPGARAAMLAVRSSAGVGDTDVETVFYLTIAAARRSIDLTSAYFAPRPAFLHALADSARSGVALRVLVPGPPHRQGHRAPHGALGVRAAARRGRAHVRVPADDAPREVAGGRRGVVDRRLGELRQPLVPAQRRDRPRRPGRGVRRAADRGLRARPRAVGRDLARRVAVASADRPAPGGRGAAAAAGALTVRPGP